MAEVNAKDLTTKTTPASTDSMLLFGTTSNEGAKITVDNLADNILGRLTTKTFANQVGGSSAATLLAQLSTLNSNIVSYHMTSSINSITIPKPTEQALLLITSGTTSYQLAFIYGSAFVVMVTHGTNILESDGNSEGQTLTRASGVTGIIRVIAIVK